MKVFVVVWLASDSLNVIASQIEWYGTIIVYFHDNSLDGEGYEKVRATSEVAPDTKIIVVGIELIRMQPTKCKKPFVLLSKIK